MKLQEYIQQRVEAGEFTDLVIEFSTLLYAGFENGGRSGNLPQLMQYVPALSESPIGEFLVVPNRSTLIDSIERILDDCL